MANVSVYNIEGKEVGSIELNDAVFGVEVNEHLVHMAVVNQLANNRQGTQSAKTRSEGQSVVDSYIGYIILFSYIYPPTPLRIATNINISTHLENLFISFSFLKYYLNFHYCCG
mgnify:CR=1 FL=1